MDRLYIEENQIIDRYLMNKLSTEETEAFEQFFLDNPELVGEIRMRKRFIRGLLNADRTHSLQAPIDGSGMIKRKSLSAFPVMRMLAVIATVILAVTAVVQYGQIKELEKTHTQHAYQLAQATSPSVNTLLVPLGRTRSANRAEAPVTRIRLPAAVEQVILDPDVRTEGFAQIRFRLERDGYGELWSQDSDTSTATVIVPATLLIPGNYHLEIQRISSGDTFVPFAKFSFTVLES